MKILSSLLLLGTLFQGCSSIDQPIASRALVENEFGPDIVLLSSEQQLVFSKDSNTRQVQINGKQAELGQVFFAASGKICRKVQFLVDGQRVYCKTDKGSWYAVSPVLASYNEADAGGNQ
ncbi:MAG: hypothetical protein ABJH06_05725 [Paraglaciecola sp.]|uniref:hypothetical protein n=1 Tax=Paraglaciecola sp. TaxID=1920173 RepID=UPI00329743A2